MGRYGGPRRRPSCGIRRPRTAASQATAPVPRPPPQWRHLLRGERRPVPFLPAAAATPALAAPIAKPFSVPTIGPASRRFHRYASTRVPGFAARLCMHQPSSSTAQGYWSPFDQHRRRTSATTSNPLRFLRVTTTSRSSTMIQRMRTSPFPVVQVHAITAQLSAVDILYRRPPARPIPPGVALRSPCHAPFLLGASPPRRSSAHTAAPSSPTTLSSSTPRPQQGRTAVPAPPPDAPYVLPARLTPGAPPSLGTHPSQLAVAATGLPRTPA